MLLLLMMMMVSRTTHTPQLPPDQFSRDLLLLLMLTGFFCRLGLGLGRRRRRC